MSKAACVCVLVLLLFSGCSTRPQVAPPTTAIAATVIAQITATAQAAVLPTSIAQTVVAELTARAPSSTPARLTTVTTVPTATLIPTVTQVPVPTITSSGNCRAFAPCARITSDIVNLRSGPGTIYPIVGTLRKGETFEISGRTVAGDWWQFSYQGKPVWVSAQLVEADSQASSIAVATAPPTPVAGPAYPVAGGSFGYGIQIDPWGDRGAAIAAVKNMGFNWVKFQLPWKDFEGQRGQRNWPDDIVGDLNGNGLNVLVSIVKAPDWARPGNTDRSVDGPPADPGTYASFVGEFAARYCGRVQAIEVWHMQNLYSEWGREPLDPARYVRLLAAAYGAIKRACPSTVVVSGALTPTGAPPPVAMDDYTYLERMYQAGLANYVEAIGAYPSGFNVAPDVPGGAPACDFIRGHGSLYMGPCSGPHHSWSFRSTMEGYRSIMLRYGDGNKRIWPTEFGWASTSSPLPGYEYAKDNTPDEQAQYSVRAYQMAKNWGWVGPMFLSNLNFGITNPGTALAAFGIWGRPAFDALAHMPK